MKIDQVYFRQIQPCLRQLRLFLIGLLLALVLLFPTFVQAQTSPEQTLKESVQEQINITKQNKPNAVVLDGETLFEIETSLGSISSEVRAENVNKKLTEIANNPTIPVESVRVEKIGDNTLCNFTDFSLGSVISL